MIQHERTALAPGAIPRTVTPDAARPGGTHVLVIEPDRPLADALANELAGAGFHADAAHDGVSAFHALDNERPDAVVLDLNVPRISGYRVLRLLRRDPATRDIPVVLLSDESFAEAAEAIRELPEAFLVKPVPPQAVAEQVHLALHRLLRHNRRMSRQGEVAA
jgi:twitching motility two-component system response regulator PilH